MTANERRARAVKKIIFDVFGASTGTPQLMNVITDALREAEKDALERAAEIVERNRPRRAGEPSTANEIRALKGGD